MIATLDRFLYLFRPLVEFNADRYQLSPGSLLEEHSFVFSFASILIYKLSNRGRCVRESAVLLTEVPLAGRFLSKAEEELRGGSCSCTETKTIRGGRGMTLVASIY